jgi:hypothetical protein
MLFISRHEAKEMPLPYACVSDMFRTQGAIFFVRGVLQIKKEATLRYAWPPFEDAA